MSLKQLENHPQLLSCLDSVNISTARVQTLHLWGGTGGREPGRIGGGRGTGGGRGKGGKREF